MRDSVRAAFVAFTSEFEGVVDFMYLDVKGLVTTAIGNLIDPVAMALYLPFVHADGTPATHSEIFAEWSAIKARRDLASHGGMAFKAIATLHLTPDGIKQVVGDKLDQVDSYLSRRFSGYATWPADAQLALLSMAWAAGPAFRFPRFEAAVAVQDFDMAAIQSHMDDTHNPGLKPRNEANLKLFGNAAAVLAHGTDPEVLHWPHSFSVGAVAPDDAPVFVLPNLDDDEPKPPPAA